MIREGASPYSLFICMFLFRLGTVTGGVGKMGTTVGQTLHAGRVGEVHDRDRVG